MAAILFSITTPAITQIYTLSLHELFRSANDCKQHSFTTDRYAGSPDYESPNRGVFAVPADCWGVSRRTARSTCSQTAVQSEQFGLPASSPCTCYSEEPCIRLCCPRPSFSGQLPFVWTGFRKWRPFP